MPSLHDIDRRISSVKSTRQITSTMYMIASTKVGRSSKRLDDSLEFTQSITQMMYDICGQNQEYVHSLLKKHEDNKTCVLIVITSDKGLAGGFNSNVLRYAQNCINQNNRDNKITKIIVCGKKANSYFEFRDINRELKYIGSSEKPSYESAEEIANWCMDNFSRENIDEVKIIYNRCKNSMEQVVTCTELLPVSREILEQRYKDFNSNKKVNVHCIEDIIYEPNSAEFLNSLIPIYLKTIVFDALLHSSAGEQVARRLAMQSATDNANEIIESLTRLYNSVRQSAITTEINEIVGGAEALKNS